MSGSPVDSSSPLFHAEGRAGGPPRVEMVAERVYAYVQPDGGWFINNTGFIVGDGGVVSIDTCATAQRTLTLLDTIEQISGRFPRTVVNTHHHGDHTNGNCLVPDATIVGHPGCRETIVAMGISRPDGIWEHVDWGELEPAPPNVTFEHRLDLYVDDMLVELHHFGTAAHTTNDVVAWIPEHKVLFTGDLIFNGGTPFVLMGSVKGSLVALDALLEFDAEIIVPGHGDVCGIEVVDGIGEYLRFLQITADEARAAGLSPLEAARQVDLGSFAGLMHPERLAGNLHRAYAECDGARPGETIDILTPFMDMVALNGGEPLPCMA